MHVTIAFGDGTTSTGSGEAVGRREGDKTRYQGLGVLGAVDAMRGEITDRLRGQEWQDLAEIEAALIELDGTRDMARLGANAIVGVSMACAAGSPRGRARAVEVADSARGDAAAAVPDFNVINGGCTRRTRWISRSS